MRQVYNQIRRHIEGFCALLKTLHEKRGFSFTLDLLLSLILFLIPYFLIVGMFFLRLRGFEKIRKKILGRVPFLSRLPGGGKVFCWITDYFTLGEIYIDRVYDRFFHPKKGFIVVDVGAHVGVYTLKTSKEVGDDGLIISVEPHPSNFRLLKLNLAINNLENVIPLNYALSSFDGRVKLYTNHPLGRLLDLTTVPRKATDEYIEVTSLTLDSLLRKLDLGKVDLVKIDVEGAELEVLKGIRDVSVDKFVIAAYHRECEVEEVKKALVLRSYEVTSINGFVYACLPGARNG